MKVLVLGCTSGVSKKVIAALHAMEVEVVGIDKGYPDDEVMKQLVEFHCEDSASPDWDRYDITNEMTFDRVYVFNTLRGNIDSIRNAALYWFTNMAAVGNAVRIANKTGATLIYLSDPEAKDGESLAYPDLETFYEGEQIVKNFSKESFIAYTEEDVLKYG